jgi:hypothetical protein
MPDVTRTVDAAPRQVIEWPQAGSGKWWVVAMTGTPDSPRYVPLYEGKQRPGPAREAECRRWLEEHPPHA